MLHLLLKSKTPILLIALCFGALPLCNAQFAPTSLQQFSVASDGITGAMGMRKIGDNDYLIASRTGSLADGTGNGNANGYFYQTEGANASGFLAYRAIDYQPNDFIVSSLKKFIVASLYTIFDGRGQDILGFDIAHFSFDGKLKWNIDLGEAGNHIKLYAQGEDYFTVVLQSDFVPDTIGGVDIRILAIDYEGNVLRDRTYGSSGDDNINASGMDANGNIVLVGHSQKADHDLVGYDAGLAHNSGFWKLVVDPQGDIIKTNLYAARDSNLIYYSSRNSTLFFDSLGNTFWPTSMSWRYNKPDFMISKEDASIIQFEETESKLVHHIYGGNSADIFYDCFLGPDETMVCVGETYSKDLGGSHEPYSGDAWFVVLNDFEVEQSYIQPGGDTPIRREHYKTGIYNSGELALLYSNGYHDPELHRFSKTSTGFTPLKNNEIQFSVFPNPSNSGVLQCSLIGNYALKDMQGRTVKTFTNTKLLDVAHISKGMYVVQHANGASLKVVIE